MYLLGLDVGTSSVKATVVDAQQQTIVASATYPETEAEIIALKPGWAEQDPERWWQYVQQAVLKCNASGMYKPHDIGAIGISYQMHGLVLVDANQNVLRNAIIWCDSRAVDIGESAFQAIGEEKCLAALLNSPGNFTASKLAWVQKNEPDMYEKIYKIMLPGDFIAMKMTGHITTTTSALSEGVFWDFQKNEISEDILRYFNFSPALFPDQKSLFSTHGYLKDNIAEKLSLTTGIPVTYKSGDQPNNALALHVMHPGEVAATAGTSGVIYGVSDKLSYDAQSRINSFAHVNHTHADKRIGILLCINGTGIFNRWMRNIVGDTFSYSQLNQLAATVQPGSEGLFTMPFGNGAERMLNNKMVGAQFSNIDFNVHGVPHMVRAVQEGIAFSFRYGLDIMRENGINPSVVRTGKANLFLSEVFAQSFANVNKVKVEYYEGDGSYGAAIGAGIGAGVFTGETDASVARTPIGMVEPQQVSLYDDLYHQWKEKLDKILDNV